jgi:hypothetical protein
MTFRRGMHRHACRVGSFGPCAESTDGNRSVYEQCHSRHVSHQELQAQELKVVDLQGRKVSV